MHPNNKEERAPHPGRPDGFGRDDRARGRPARADLSATTGQVDQRPLNHSSPDPEREDEHRRRASERWRHAPPTD